MEAANGLMFKPPIRISFLMDQYLHPYGGTERQVLELIRHLDRKRTQPQVTVLRQSGYADQNTFDCPVQVLNVGKIASIASMKKVYSYARELREQNYSIVHIFFNDASIIAPPFLKCHGLKVLVSRRDMGFWYTAVNKILLKRTRYFVDQVIVNSQAVKRNVQEAEGYADADVRVIHNGYVLRQEHLRIKDPGIREKHGIGRNDQIIGIVANLRAIKRIDDLVRAFGMIAHSYRDRWLIIVGTGDQQKKLELLASELGISDRVVFAGQIMNVLPYIREFTVGVLCSESEGFSNSIIEYMSCGKPTVCTNVGGNPEIIQDGKNGYLVEVGHVRDLAERINRLLGDPELTTRLGNNALAEVRQKYGLERMVSAHMELYERLVLSG